MATLIGELQNGSKFNYILPYGGDGPGKGMVAGGGRKIHACPYCNVHVCLLNMTGMSRRDVSNRMRAIGWAQVNGERFMCAECMADPMALESVRGRLGQPQGNVGPSLLVGFAPAGSPQAMAQPPAAAFAPPPMAPQALPSAPPPTHSPTGQPYIQFAPADGSPPAALPHAPAPPTSYIQFAPQNEAAASAPPPPAPAPLPPPPAPAPYVAPVAHVAPGSRGPDASPPKQYVTPEAPAAVPYTPPAQRAPHPPRPGSLPKTRYDGSTSQDWRSQSVARARPPVAPPQVAAPVAPVAPPPVGQPAPAAAVRARPAPQRVVSQSYDRSAGGPGGGQTRVTPQVIPPGGVQMPAPPIAMMPQDAPQAAPAGHSRVNMDIALAEAAGITFDGSPPRMPVGMPSQLPEGAPAVSVEAPIEFVKETG